MSIIRKAINEKPFIRFLLVGGLNTLVGLSITYVLLHICNFSYWGATITGNSTGAIFSYVMNRTFTFKSRASMPRSILRFAFVILCCYFLSFYLGLLLANRMEAIWSNHIGTIVKDAAVVISTGIYTITNYFGQKLIVFRETENQYDAEA
ncbi:GtrA family protein [Paenibacillus sp. OV219]|uniref:GtrA family protein n=1 Tax=Paenibacillus sp. OV219 TaxID=1884377 RepID=UPI0008AB16BE|nr:GtrA family protein [Paenibacillus sp. OV219]SEM54476.1 Putative flippase GtrA (transmembrane translocase of bactoprenol-linked glucose) [Paenibacillus sp. OV219]